MRQSLLLVLLLGVPASATTRASSITPQMDKLLLEGIDALGRRAEAVAAYKAALAERKLWDFHRYLKRCLSKPCSDGQPGHFSPPY